MHGLRTQKDWRVQRWRSLGVLGAALGKVAVRSQTERREVVFYYTIAGYIMESDIEKITFH
jgi:hypothetical protein